MECLCMYVCMYVCMYELSGINQVAYGKYGFFALSIFLYILAVQRVGTDTRPSLFVFPVFSESQEILCLRRRRRRRRRLLFPCLPSSIR